MKEGQINRVSLAKGWDYLKITEYVKAQDNIWEKTYYLTSDNKLLRQIISFGTRYHTQHWERF